MDIQKIVIVAIFLSSLLLLQYALRSFRAKNTDVSSSSGGVKLQSRLKLSTDDRIDVVSIHGQSFFIILSKGAQPIVQAIDPEKVVTNREVES
jgi:MFS superfamily sulfate permease-like transporter